MERYLKIFACIPLLVISCVLTNCQDREASQKQPAFQGQNVEVDGQIRSLQDIVRKNPKDINGWIQLGNIFMDVNQYHDAIEAYQGALHINPELPDVMVDLGTCYRRIGRPDKAVEKYKEALKINPRHPNAHRNLGIVLGFDLSEKKQAIEELKEYLELVPQAPDRNTIQQAIEKLQSV